MSHVWMSLGWCGGEVTDCSRKKGLSSPSGFSAESVRGDSRHIAANAPLDATKEVCGTLLTDSSPARAIRTSTGTGVTNDDSYDSCLRGTVI